MNGKVDFMVLIHVEGRDGYRLYDSKFLIHFWDILWNAHMNINNVILFISIENAILFIFKSEKICVFVCVHAPQLVPRVSSINGTIHSKHIIDNECIGNKFKYGQIPWGYQQLLWLVVELPTI
jgi:hypothetical protein